MREHSTDGLGYLLNDSGDRELVWSREPTLVTKLVQSTCGCIDGKDRNVVIELIGNIEEFTGGIAPRLE